MYIITTTTMTLITTNMNIKTITTLNFITLVYYDSHHNYYYHFYHYYNQIIGADFSLVDESKQDKVFLSTADGKLAAVSIYLHS